MCPLPTLTDGVCVCLQNIEASRTFTGDKRGFLAEKEKYVDKDRVVPVSLHVCLLLCSLSFLTCVLLFCVFVSISASLSLCLSVFLSFWLFVFSCLFSPR